MKTWKLLLPIPFVAMLLAMMPQGPQGSEDPAVTDIVTVTRMSELQYVDGTGKVSVVPSRNVVEVRLIDDRQNAIRLEIVYDNGDYSLIDAQAVHILRSGRELMDVRLVRSRQARMRFPKLN